VFIITIERGLNAMPDKICQVCLPPPIAEKLMELFTAVHQNVPDLEKGEMLNRLGACMFGAAVAQSYCLKADGVRVTAQLIDESAASMKEQIGALNDSLEAASPANPNRAKLN
jgi:hypothetical protein